MCPQHLRCSRRGSVLGLRAAADLPLPTRAFQKYQALPEATDDLRRAQLFCVTQGTWLYTVPPPGLALLEPQSSV